MRICVWFEYATLTPDGHAWYVSFLVELFLCHNPFKHAEVKYSNIFKQLKALTLH